MSMEHSWFVIRKVVTMTIHFQVNYYWRLQIRNHFVFLAFWLKWVTFSPSNLQCVTAIRLNIIAYDNWMRVDFSLLVAQHSGNWAYSNLCFKKYRIYYFCVFSCSDLITFFRTLQELVEHYSKDSDGLCVNLRSACVQVKLFNFILAIFFQLYISTILFATTFFLIKNCDSHQKHFFIRENQFCLLIQY